MLKTLIVEDNLRLQAALKTGLEATGVVQVVGAAARGEDAVEYCLAWGPIDVILMDVALAGEMNGIAAAVAIRREYPRQPLVFYSIQDDDAYYRAFRAAGILSHYAYVRKSNYLLPEMIVPLLRDAAGLTNEQIAARLGLRDKRTISRTNGQIYTAWGLADSATDEKTARTRAAIIVQSGQLMRWDPQDGRAYVLNARGEWEERAP